MDIWKILEIEYTTNEREIKKAYAKLIKIYHPEEYPEEFKRINEAYKIAIASTKNDFKQSINLSNIRTYDSKKEINETNQSEDINDDSSLEDTSLFDNIIEEKKETKFESDEKWTVSKKLEYENARGSVFTALQSIIDSSNDDKIDALNYFTKRYLFKSVYKSEKFIVELIRFLEYFEVSIEVWRCFYNIYKKLIEDGCFDYKSEWIKYFNEVRAVQQIILEERHSKYIELLTRFAIAILFNASILLFIGNQLDKTSVMYLLEPPFFIGGATMLLSKRYKEFHFMTFLLKCELFVYLTLIIAPLIALAIYYHSIPAPVFGLLLIASMLLIGIELKYYFKNVAYCFNDICLRPKKETLKNNRYEKILLTSFTIKLLPIFIPGINSSTYENIVGKYFLILLFFLFFGYMIYQSLISGYFEKFEKLKTYQNRSKIMMAIFYPITLIYYFDLFNNLEIILQEISLLYCLIIPASEIFLLLVIYKFEGSFDKMYNTFKNTIRKQKEW